MKTQRPLRDMVSDLAQHILDHQDYLLFNKRILNIFEGQLKPEIEADLRRELSPESFERARHRIPSFNLLSRITNKLSKVYMKPAMRRSDRTADQKSLDLWVKYTKFDDKMRQANKMLNLHKITAVEPFIQDGKPNLRVIPAHQFLPYSDNPSDPTDMTVFIKFLGSTTIPNPFTDRDGELSDPDEDLVVGRYIAYSEDEIVEFQAGYKHQTFTQITSERFNPIGRIPQTLLSRSDYRLIPIPDSDSLNNTILIPKMYANLAYAVNLQAHGQMVGIDVDMNTAQLRKGPDVVWSFQTSDEARGQGKQGKLDAVKVEIDIEEVNMLVQNILSVWLETRNLKSGTTGQSSEQRASGAAKIIDQADATEDIETQKSIFADAEPEIWETIKQVNNAEFESINPKLKFRMISNEFDVKTTFQVSRPVINPVEAVSYVRERMALGLMSRKQAIKYLHPEFNEDESQRWLDEAMEDQDFLEGISSGVAGQFGEGNQAAVSKGTESNPNENLSDDDSRDDSNKD